MTAPINAVSRSGLLQYRSHRTSQPVRVCISFVEATDVYHKAVAEAMLTCCH